MGAVKGGRRVKMVCTMEGCGAVYMDEVDNQQGKIGYCPPCLTGILERMKEVRFERSMDTRPRSKDGHYLLKAGSRRMVKEEEEEWTSRRMVKDRVRWKTGGRRLAQ